MKKFLDYILEYDYYLGNLFLEATTQGATKEAKLHWTFYDLQYLAQFPPTYWSQAMKLRHSSFLYDAWLRNTLDDTFKALPENQSVDEKIEQIYEQFKPHFPGGNGKDRLMGILHEGPRDYAFVGLRIARHYNVFFVKTNANILYHQLTAEVNPQLLEKSNDLEEYESVKHDEKIDGERVPKYGIHNLHLHFSKPLKLEGQTARIKEVGFEHRIKTSQDAVQQYLNLLNDGWFGDMDKYDDGELRFHNVYKSYKVFDANHIRRSNQYHNNWRRTRLRDILQKRPHVLDESDLESDLSAYDVSSIDEFIENFMFRQDDDQRIYPFIRPNFGDFGYEASQIPVLKPSQEIHHQGLNRVKKVKNRVKTLDKLINLENTAIGAIIKYLSMSQEALNAEHKKLEQVLRRDKPTGRRGARHHERNIQAIETQNLIEAALKLQQVLPMKLFMRLPHERQVEEIKKAVREHDINLISRSKVDYLIGRHKSSKFGEHLSGFAGSIVEDPDRMQNYLQEMHDKLQDEKKEIIQNTRVIDPLQAIKDPTFKSATETGIRINPYIMPREPGTESQRKKWDTIHKQYLGYIDDTIKPVYSKETGFDELTAQVINPISQRYIESPIVAGVRQGVKFLIQGEESTRTIIRSQLEGAIASGPVEVHDRIRNEQLGSNLLQIYFNAYDAWQKDDSEENRQRLEKAYESAYELIKSLSSKIIRKILESSVKLASKQRPDTATVSRKGTGRLRDEDDPYDDADADADEEEITATHETPPETHPETSTKVEPKPEQLYDDQSLNIIYHKIRQRDKRSDEDIFQTMQSQYGINRDKFTHIRTLMPINIRSVTTRVTRELADKIIDNLTRTQWDTYDPLQKQTSIKTNLNDKIKNEIIKLLQAKGLQLDDALEKTIISQNLLSTLTQDVIRLVDTNI